MRNDVLSRLQSTDTWRLDRVSNPYAPRAIELRFDAIEQSPEALCREVLALTKMNWNNTHFDMREPITLRAARRVGDIMKYVSDDVPADAIAKRYSFYM